MLGPAVVQSFLLGGRFACGMTMTPRRREWQMADKSATALQKKFRAAAMKSQFIDFETFLPSVRMRVVLDVGANVGQSTRAIRHTYPEARIFSFEPVKESFQALEDLCRGDAKTECFNLALGDSEGQATMETRGAAVSNRIIAEPSRRTTTAAVAVSTGDVFCATHGIDSIDFLKIDTEGYDLKVCRGFAGMIARQKIDLIQVETSMTPDNHDHVPLQTFVEFFSPLGYLLFRLYDQELSLRRPRLRRANAVFVSPVQLEIAAKTQAAPKKRPSPVLAQL